MLRQTGALELYSNGEGYQINASRPAGYNAPWSRNPALKNFPTKDIESPNELNEGETDHEPQEKPELE